MLWRTQRSFDSTAASRFREAAAALRMTVLERGNFLMTTSNAAVDKTGTTPTAKAPAEKDHEKLAEKRRALGRGLASLLPGPRAVALPPTLPQSARKDGAPDSGNSSVSAAGSQETGAASPSSSSPSSLSSSSAELLDGRVGTAVGFHLLERAALLRMSWIRCRLRLRGSAPRGGTV